MKLRQLLEAKDDCLDTYDSVYDCVVTVALVYENDITDEYDKFLYRISQDVDVTDARHNECDWVGFIDNYKDQLTAFMIDYWQDELLPHDIDDFYCKWINEIHLYCAGEVDLETYDDLLCYLDGRGIEKTKCDTGSRYFTEELREYLGIELCNWYEYIANKDIRSVIINACAFAEERNLEFAFTDDVQRLGVKKCVSSLDMNINNAQTELSFSFWQGEKAIANMTRSQIVDYVIDNFEDIVGVKIADIFNKADESNNLVPFFNQDVIEKTAKNIIERIGQDNFSKVAYLIDEKLTEYYHSHLPDLRAEWDKEIEMGE